MSLDIEYKVKGVWKSLCKLSRAGGRRALFNEAAEIVDRCLAQNGIEPLLRRSTDYRIKSTEPLNKGKTL